MRVLLETHPGEHQLHTAAEALGLSARTLQRRLTASGTTFLKESGDAQIRRAQRMMIESELKLTSVAVEVGCSSLANFGALFRKATGESPSAWRARHRRS